MIEVKVATWRSEWTLNNQWWWICGVSGGSRWLSAAGQCFNCPGPSLRAFNCSNLTKQCQFEALLQSIATKKSLKRAKRTKRRARWSGINPVAGFRHDWWPPSLKDWHFHFLFFNFLLLLSSFAFRVRRFLCSHVSFLPFEEERDRESRLVPA